MILFKLGPTSTIHATNFPFLPAENDDTQLSRTEQYSSSVTFPDSCILIHLNLSKVMKILPPLEYNSYFLILNFYLSKFLMLKCSKRDKMSSILSYKAKLSWDFLSRLDAYSSSLCENKSKEKKH